MFEKKFILFRAWLFTEEGNKLWEGKKEGLYPNMTIQEITVDNTVYGDFYVDYAAIVSVQFCEEFRDHCYVQCDGFDAFLVKGSPSDILSDIQRQFYAKTQLREN